MLKQSQFQVFVRGQMDPYHVKVVPEPGYNDYTLAVTQIFALLHCTEKLMFHEPWILFSEGHGLEFHVSDEWLQIH